MTESPTAVQLHRELTSGERTAVDVTEQHLSLIHKLNPSLGAFTWVADDAAREQAQTLDETRQNHRGDAYGPASPLFGMPLGIKDLHDVAGMPTSLGHSAEGSFAEPVKHDSDLTATLRQAGAVFVGKTNTPEFGLPSHTDNEISIGARNPLHPERTAGGSSGGAASAVASGMLPVAPGTDGGGSIRIPAAACGLVGLKPGRGAVPTDAQQDSVRNMGVSGPLARNAADAALLYDCMVDAQAKEGLSLATVREAQDQGLDRTTTFGITTASPFHNDLDISLSRGSIEALTRAAAVLGQDGYRVDEVDISYPSQYFSLFTTLWTAGFARSAFSDDVIARMGPLATNFYERGSKYSAQLLSDTTTQLTDWSIAVRRQFAQADIMLTPVLAFVPPEVGTFSAMDPEDNYAYQCKFTPYTSMINVMGLPAISIPILTDEDGFSWSVQAVGRPGTEAQLLALAARMEILLT